jgi:hypothetical protein
MFYGHIVQHGWVFVKIRADKRDIRVYASLDVYDTGKEVCVACREKSPPEDGGRNPPVERCVLAWKRTYYLIGS